MLSFLILFINFVLQLKTDKDKSFGAPQISFTFTPDLICETFTFFLNPGGGYSAQPAWCCQRRGSRCGQHQGIIHGFITTLTIWWAHMLIEPTINQWNLWKVNISDQQVWRADPGETGSRTLLFTWHCHDHRGWKYPRVMFYVIVISIALAMLF